MNNPGLKIFCDFDGTITRNDVWVTALGRFIKDKKEFSNLCKLFENNLITGRQCIKKELDLVEDFNFEDFNSFIENEKPDNYFFEFKNYCDENNYEIILLSEGLDYYIEYFLKKEKLELKYFSNKLIAEKSKEIKGKIYYKLSCEFPYSDEHCNWCGMSKRNIIINNTDDFSNQVSVFIGDGVSDFCASNYADIVFAKKSLASFCWKNNITYFDFKNFNDVIKKLKKLISENKIKQKQQARNLRRDVVLGG